VSKEDARIVEAVLKGHTDAFRLLVEKYYTMVYKFFTAALTPHDENVDDLCQDTFLSVFQGLSSLDNKERFKSWLFGIAANKLRSEFRKRKKERDLQGALAGEEKIKQEELNKGEVDEERVKELVWKGLSRLDGKLKEVITMKYFGNLTYEEIGEALDIPRSTVRGRMYRAYQKLRSIFKEEAGEV